MHLAGILNGKIVATILPQHTGARLIAAPPIHRHRGLRDLRGPYDYMNNTVIRLYTRPQRRPRRGPPRHWRRRAAPAPHHRHSARPGTWPAAVHPTVSACEPHPLAVARHADP